MSVQVRVSLITQFDGPLIEFGDGLQSHCASVIGGVIPANGDVAIKIDLAAAAHDRGSLKKIAPSEVAHQPIRTLRDGGFDGTRAATAAPRASSASAKVCGSGTGLRSGGGALAAAALRTATTYRVVSLLRLNDPPVCGEKISASCDDDDVPDQYKLVP